MQKYFLVAKVERCSGDSFEYTFPTAWGKNESHALASVSSKLVSKDKIVAAWIAEPNNLKSKMEQIVGDNTHSSRAADSYLDSVRGQYKVGERAAEKARRKNRVRNFVQKFTEVIKPTPPPKPKKPESSYSPPYNVVKARTE